MFKAYGSSTATGRNKLLEATREETGHLDGFPLRSSQRLLKPRLFPLPISFPGWKAPQVLSWWDQTLGQHPLEQTRRLSEALRFPEKHGTSLDALTLCPGSTSGAECS